MVELVEIVELVELVELGSMVQRPRSIVGSLLWPDMALYY